MGFWKRPDVLRPSNISDAISGPLSNWRCGAEAVVTAVTGASRFACRLREIGVVPGVRVRVLRTGSNLVIQVGEGRFCMRRRDAFAIQVCSAGAPLPVPSLPSSAIAVAVS